MFRSQWSGRPLAGAGKCENWYTLFESENCAPHESREVELIRQSEGTGSSAVEMARDAVMDLVAAGHLAAGQRLPPERELAASLGVSRTTLREALGQLARAGYVSRKPGRGGGTFVCQPKIDRDLSVLRGLPDHLRRQGHVSSNKVLATRLMTADRKTAVELELADGMMVFELVRLRLSDGEPISMERSRFPADRFPGLLEQPLGGSVYALLRDQYSVLPHRARERIEPVSAGPHEAESLCIDVGQPLLAVERVTYDEAGVPVEFGRDLFRGDRTRVVVWIESGSEGQIELVQSP